MSEAFEILDASARERLTPEELPHGIRPMLATLSHEHFDHPDWIYERKFDGQRLLMFRGRGEVRLRSRNGQDLGATYPEVADAVARLDAPDLVLDGEVVAFDGNVTSFSRLQQRMQVDDPEEARATGIKVYYYVFDILHAEGFALEDLPLRSRKKILRQLLCFDGALRFTPHRNAEGEAYHAEACEKGWEGIIAKRADSRYKHSRSRDWLKFKCQKGQELVIGGLTEPEGSRVGFGALLVGYYEGDELRYAGKVGTGYDDEFLREFRDRLDGLSRKTSPFADEVSGTKSVTWVTPKLVGEFGFTEWTDSGKLRHPRFLGLRRDKNAQDVVREE